MGLDVTNADVPAGDSQGGGDAEALAGEADFGLAAGLGADFDVGPRDATAPPGSQNFQHRLLGREPTGEPLNVSLGIPAAVFLFQRGKTAVKETRAMINHELPNSLGLHQIDPMSDNRHRFSVRRAGEGNKADPRLKTGYRGTEKTGEAPSGAGLHQCMGRLCGNSRSDPKRLLAIVVSFGIAIALLHPLYVSNIRLQRRIRLMRAQAVTLGPLLATDSRFANLRPCTDDSGTLKLRGPLDSPLAFDELTRLVRDTNSGIPVLIEVTVPCRVGADRPPVLVPLQARVGPSDE